MLNVLLVDNDETQLEIYSLALSPHFNVQSCQNFIEAQSIIEQDDIHIVLCEWSINGINASQLQPLLRREKSYTFPVVVVVSEDSTESSMVAAFNGGATFYFTKPYKVVQFTENLLTLKNQIETYNRFEKQVKSSEEQTRSAISDKSIYEMGMGLVSAVAEDDRVDDVARRLLRGLRLYGIHGSIQFRHHKQVHTFDTDMTEGDENLQGVFSVLQKQGAVYCFGQRVMFNYGNASLLVKHIANENEHKRESIINMLSNMMPIVATMTDKITQHSALYTTYSDFSHVQQRLNSSVNRRHVVKQDLLLTVKEKLQEAALDFDFSPSEEEWISQLVEDTIEEALGNTEQLGDVCALMLGVSERLEKRLQVNGELNWAVRKQHIN